MESALSQVIAPSELAPVNGKGATLFESALVSADNSLAVRGTAAATVLPCPSSSQSAT
jgi:hypothetical protein